MATNFVSFIALFILFLVQAYAGTMDGILSYNQKLRQVTSEEVLYQEMESLAELLNDPKPALLNIELSDKDIVPALKELTELKQAIRSAQDQMDSKLIKVKKTCLTRIRYLEDYFNERKYIKERKKTEQFDIRSLKDGDLVLLRGYTVVSSSVARVAEIPSVYSHVGIVHVDSLSGKKMLVEALPRVGVVANPIEAIVAEPYPRITVYRSKNSLEAQRASNLAYQMANYIGKNKNPFGFDFGMHPAIDLPVQKEVIDGKEKFTFDTSDITKCNFFCSKLVRYVFYQLDQTNVIGKHESEFRKSVESVKDAVGVLPEVTKTFLPADIELDPGFDFLFEYSDPARTLESRIDDFVTDEIYNKIAYEGMVLKLWRAKQILAVIVHKIISVKKINELLKAMGMPMSPVITPNLMVTLHNIDKIVSITKKKLFALQATSRLDLNSLSSSELKALIHSEFTSNPKIQKYFVKNESASSKMCLGFYRGF